MGIETLTAMERTEKGKKSRRQGFVPAVLYGKQVSSTSVQFKKPDVDKFIRVSGLKSRLVVDFDNQKRIGIVKDAKTDPVSGVLQHLQIQIVNTNETVNAELPIIFNGREDLEGKKLILLVEVDSIKVKGVFKDIPESITLDVSGLEANDVITVADLPLNDNLTVDNSEDKVIATVKYELAQEEEEEETVDDTVEEF